MASIFIPTDSNPTPVENKEWVGTALGRLLVSPVLLFVSNPLIASIVAATGLIGGYFVGKNNGEKQRAKELRDGVREVKSPSYFNKGLAKGYTISAISVGIAVAIAGTVLAGSILAPALVLTTAVVGLGLIVGGSIKGKETMVKEYERAQRIVDSRAVGIDRSQTPQLEMSQSPSRFAEMEAARRAQQTQKFIG